MARRKRRTSAKTSEARREQARNRPRHESGRFLTKAEMAQRQAEAESASIVEAGPGRDESVSVSNESGRERLQPPRSSSVSAQEFDEVLSRFENDPEPVRQRGKSALERSLARHERRLRL